MIKLISLDVDGFKNLRIDNLNFPSEGNILLTGRNESGKSSLFEAIFFALTSKLLVKHTRGFADAIAFDKEVATIDLIFQKKGIPARIKKKIFKTKTGTSVEIEFWENYTTGKEQSLNGRTAELDPIIEKFLGFDDQILLNSSFVKQKGLEGFMEETKQDRIKILNKLLNMEKLTDLKVQYKKDLKEKELIESYFEKNLKIEEISIEINRVKDETENLKQSQKKFREIKDLSSKMEHIISEYDRISKKNIEIDGKLLEFQKELQLLQSDMEDQKKYKDQAIECEKIKNESNLLKKDKETLLKDLPTNERYLTDVEEKINQYLQNQKNLQQTNEELKIKKNETQKFENWKKILTNFNNLRNDISSLSSQIDSLKKRIQEIELELNEFETELREKVSLSFQEYDKSVKSAREFDHTLQILNDKSKRFSVENKLLQLKKKEEELNKKIEEYKSKSEKLNNLIETQQKKEIELKSLEKSLITLSKEESESLQYASLKSKISENNKKKESINQEILNLEKKLKEEQDRLKPYKKRLNEIEISKDKESIPLKKSLLIKLSPIYVGIILLGLILSILLSPLYIIFIIIGCVIGGYSYVREKSTTKENKMDSLTIQLIKDIDNRITDLKNTEIKFKAEIPVLNDEESDLKRKISDYDIKKPSWEISKEINSNKTKITEIKTQIQMHNENKEDLKKHLNSLEFEAFQKEYEAVKSEILQIDDEIIEREKNKPLKDKEQVISIEFEKIREEISETQNKIKNLRDNCISICKDVGIILNPEEKSLNKFYVILENDIAHIQKIINQNCNWKNWNQFYSNFNNFPMLKKSLNQFSEKRNDILSKSETLFKLASQMELKEEECSKLNNEIPDIYKENYQKFEDDFNIITLSKANFENKKKDLEEYFSENKLDDLENNKKNFETIVTEIKRNLDKLGIELQKKEKDLNNIMNLLPKQYQDSKIKINEERIKKLNTEITKLKTSIDAEWENYFKAIKIVFQDELKIEIIDAKKNEFKDKLEKVYQDIKKKLNAIILKISKAIPTFSDTSNEEYINTYLSTQMNKIGGLDEEIKSSRTFIEKLKKDRSDSKIIESLEIDSKNLKTTYETARKSCKILNKAIEILEDGQNCILEKVTPKTEEFLSKILPILTADRYKDAKISGDYKIQVFDSKMEGYVEKTLFSGGTNDQIALAIRLSFAMVTMPEESINESFIFLDEPLGFFDDERKAALIDFLTHGAIADKFAQRIVISNFLTIKPYFDFVIELENGKMIDQYSTSSLETIQIGPEYGIPESKRFIELESIKFSEEDDYIEEGLRIINISDEFIYEIQIDIYELNISISPKIIYNLKPGDGQRFTIDYNQRIIEEENIDFNITIVVQEGGNKIQKFQKIRHTPQIKK